MPIVDKLKEALKPGRKETSDEGDLNKLLASSAKKVLLQKIEFEPASKGFSYQLDSLKNKYVILNPRTEGATGQKATEPAQIKRQGEEFVSSFVAALFFGFINLAVVAQFFYLFVFPLSQPLRMWLGVRAMGSQPHRRCSFQGTSLLLNGSVCTGWELVFTTWETPASSTPPSSVSPTPRHLPTTYCQRSTAVPVSI